MSARSGFPLLEYKLPVLNMPSPATPSPTTVVPTATSAAPPANTASVSLTADFLAMLAGMKSPPASGVPGGSKARPNLPGLSDLPGLPQLPELMDLSASEDPASKDDKGTSRDEPSLEDATAPSALALPVLALPMLAPPQIASGDVGTQDPSSDAVEPAPDRTPTNAAVSTDLQAVLAELTSQLAASAPKESATPADATGSPAAPTGDAPAAETTLDSLSASATPQTSHLHALANAHTMPDTDPAAPREIRSPMGTPAWTHELGDHIAQMTQHGLESASLRLAPEHLGPLEVRISMHEGEATVWFGAANADTRAALDQSLPRLREMFAAQGMVLTDAGVFREAPRQPPKPATVSSNSIGSSDATDGRTVSAISQKRLRLLDTYA